MSRKSKKKLKRKGYRKRKSRLRKPKIILNPDGQKS
jgi:hypothetical protein